MLLSAAVIGLLAWCLDAKPGSLLFTAGLLGLAWWIRGREQKAPAEPKPVKIAENNTVVEATWNDVQLEDSLGMEVGYRLIPMVDFRRMVSCGRYAVLQELPRRWDSTSQWCTFATISICNLPAIALNERRGDWQW
ncbi:hypothetical protein ACLK1S_11790 [Escherichia coli]